MVKCIKFVILGLIIGMTAVISLGILGFAQVIRAWNDIFK